MELALSNGFCQVPQKKLEVMSMEELMIVEAGGWADFGLALGGTLCIAASPIVAATGNVPGALILAGTGCGLIGSI